MKQVLCLVLCWCSIGSVDLFAHEEGHAGLRHWELASPDPDRMFLSFDGDAATSRAVTWRTDTSVEQAFAEIVEADASPGFSDLALRIDAITEALDLKLWSENLQGAVNYHSAVFENLQPETLYAYRVGDGKERWSEWIQFKTASAEEKPFSFVYFGDAQNDVFSHWSRTLRMAYQTAPDAAFALHAGDLINVAHADSEWAGWFQAGGFLHAQWTGIPVTGNHEYRKLEVSQSNQVVSVQWRPQFTLPVVAGLPEELHETVYSIEYQGSLIIVLNSNKLIKEQASFLEETLKESKARWKVVAFHHPLFPPRGRMSDQNRKMHEFWRPMFEKYNVDLVLQGHDHAYSRGQVPVRSSDGFEEGTFQTMYVTSVSGPKQYEIKRDVLKGFEEQGLETSRTGENTQFFQVVHVDGSELVYKAYTATGELYDAVRIERDPGSGRKKLTSMAPQTEERSFQNTLPYESP